MQRDCLNSHSVPMCSDRCERCGSTMLQIGSGFHQSTTVRIYRKPAPK